MSILRDISVIWSLIHTLILFVLLFEPRYSRKKSMVLILATMVPLILVNFALFIILGADTYSSLMILTLSVPSLIGFWFLARHRDGRFFFTFCMVDTVALEITYLTQILDHFFVPGDLVFAFTFRLLIYPLLEWLVIKKLRAIYLDVQHHSPKGWGIFTLISAIFYVIIILHMTVPTLITSRPDDLPVAFLLFLLMPTIYIHIIFTLRNQQNAHETAQREAILKLQVENMTTRMEELNTADKKFRMERHNFRHKLKTIASLVETKQYSELSALLEEYSESIREAQVKHYCQSPVIDAVLATYLQRAENKGIRVTAGLAFPDAIPTSETELGTVLANALENAICACEKLEENQRYIDIRVLSHPRFLIQIANSFDGNVEFDEDEIPVSRSEGHGFGTRSIAAFCEMHGVYYRFRAEDKKFTLQLNF